MLYFQKKIQLCLENWNLKNPDNLICLNLTKYLRFFQHYILGDFHFCQNRYAFSLLQVLDLKSSVSDNVVQSKCLTRTDRMSRLEETNNDRSTPN